MISDEKRTFIPFPGNSGSGKRREP